LPAGAGGARVVEIPVSSDTFDIAARLKGAGLIRSPAAFHLGLYRWGLAGKLKAGYYRLAPSMSASEIAETIASGKVATEKVTIPEGFTVAQIAERLEATGLCRAQAFAVVPPEELTSRELIPTGSLEGYLFPATYVIEYGTDAPGIADQMVDAFEQRITQGMAADLVRSRRPLSQIVTVASLIEREARVAKDRPLIASVIYNRLQKGMRLQIDATVLYALGRHKSRVTLQDLKVDSPFNTYRHAGLPPHPICNPGEASVRAALRPAKTHYLYYVARPDGSHVFTRTYAEHLQAIRALRGG
jgi:UPF0755 protein